MDHNGVSLLPEKNVHLLDLEETMSLDDSGALSFSSLDMLDDIPVVKEREREEDKEPESALSLAFPHLPKSDDDDSSRLHNNRDFARSSNNNDNELDYAAITPLSEHVDDEESSTTDQGSSSIQEKRSRRVSSGSEQLAAGTALSSTRTSNSSMASNISDLEQQQLQLPNHLLYSPNLNIKTESILAQEFQSMTVQERELVTFDIHGLSERQEDPKNIDKLLEDMDQSLKELQGQEQLVYDAACQQGPTYIASRKFRLSFLRSESYCINDAVDRFLRHLQLKVRLFGMENVGRKIAMKDLGEEEKACVKSGMGQLLPLSDRSGRPVFLWSSRFKDQFSLAARVSHLHLSVCAFSIREEKILKILFVHQF